MSQSKKEKKGLDDADLAGIIGVTIAVCALCFVLGIYVGVNIFK